jgi:hypothetical protein
MGLKISFGKNERFEHYLQSVQYKKIEERSERTVYEGIFEMGVAKQVLGLDSREFAKFCRSIEVEGGRKKKEGDHLIITPRRSRVLRVRFSPEEYSTIEETASDYDIDVAKFVRGAVFQIIAKRRKILPE